jgi:lambda repressor-like predicted transcriptional regulator
MTNADFAGFLKRNGLSLDAAAIQLGVSRRLVAYYAKDRPVPRYIALACKAIEWSRMQPAP